MNTLMRSLAAANGVRLRLGAGEPGLYTLLGGFGAEAEDGSLFGAGGGSAGAYSRITAFKADPRFGGGTGSKPTTGGGVGTPPETCVDVDSWLPGGIRARDVLPTMLLQVVNPDTLERGLGQVTHSHTAQALRYRIACANGVQLVCSESAPIPTDLGYLKPSLLLGRLIVAQVDGELLRVRVVDVQRLGMGEVQHITCGNQCFLAGEIDGYYLLHHNAKNTDISDPGGGF